MGRSQRDKGRRGQREALDLLAEHGYTVAETNAGTAVEDMFAVDPQGRPVAVEVKHCAAIRLAAFRVQAREQARRRGCGWLLLCRLPGHPGVFLAEGSNVPPRVMRSNVARFAGA